MARLALGAVLLLSLAACRAPRNELAEWQASPNYNARRPQMVVLHHTASSSFERALKLLKTHNDGGPVSSHYLIASDGRLAQLVSDDHRAWHAGGGSWGPYRDLNALSIGIELDNDGYQPFPQPQIDRLLTVLADLTRRYGIAPSQILGHADVDPVRKVDPNANFPWKLLAERGFGLWPDEVLAEPPAGFDPWTAMQVIGYSLRDRSATLRAFHRHYRGVATGPMDGQDARILFNLQAKVLRER